MRPRLPLFFHPSGSPRDTAESTAHFQCSRERRHFDPSLSTKVPSASSGICAWMNFTAKLEPLTSRKHETVPPSRQPIKLYWLFAGTELCLADLHFPTAPSSISCAAAVKFPSVHIFYSVEFSLPHIGRGSISSLFFLFFPFF